MKEEWFRVQYEHALVFLEPYLEQDFVKQVSAPNPAFGGASRDFKPYLERSYLRYKNMVPWIKEGMSWLDVGGLFSAFPIALSLCGVKVTVCERLDYYPPELRSFYETISREFDIKFWNMDLNHSRASVDFDAISFLSVIEHLPHTPKLILERIRSMLKGSGSFFIDVPNIYYSSTILNYLKGKNVIPVETYFNSTIPYAGHFREYGKKDLEYVLENSGFEIEQLDFFNYSNDLTMKHFFRPWGWPVVLSQLNPFREMMFCRSVKK